MVTSGNGNNEYSIRKRYPKRLESWEILKQCELRFPKCKTTKKSKNIPNTSYSKTKNRTNTMIRN